MLRGGQSKEELLRIKNDLRPLALCDRKQKSPAPCGIARGGGCAHVGGNGREAGFTDTPYVTP
jgi:hypothetical protein